MSSFGNTVVFRKQVVGKNLNSHVSQKDTWLSRHAGIHLTQLAYIEYLGNRCIFEKKKAKHLSSFFSVDPLFESKEDSDFERVGMIILIKFGKACCTVAILCMNLKRSVHVQYSSPCPSHKNYIVRIWRMTPTPLLGWQQLSVLSYMRAKK